MPGTVLIVLGTTFNLNNNINRGQCNYFSILQLIKLTFKEFKEFGHNFTAYILYKYSKKD